MSPDAVQLVRHRLAAAWLVALAAACTGAEAVPGSTPVDCATSARDDKPSVALAVCQREYDQTRDPETGARLAEQMLRNRTPGRAKDLATSLLPSTARASALRVLGWLALGERRLDEAEAALDEARERHLAQHMVVDVARDLIPLAGVLVARGRYPELLRAYAACIAYASFSDRVIAGVCHLTAAESMLRIGNLELATTELEHADPMLKSDWHRAQYELAHGNLQQELARKPLHMTRHKQAEQAFVAARKYAVAVDFQSRIVAADLNLAYTLAELGRTAEAQRHLDDALRLDPKVRDADVLQANIEYRRGDLDAARSRIERIYPQLTDHDERIVMASLQARIALAKREPSRAIEWAQRGIEAVEALRAQMPLEHRAWTLATRREPYELLFVAHVRAGHPRDALLSIDGWQGRAARDSIATSRRGRGLVGAAEDVETLQHWLAPDPARGVADLSSIDLLAVLVADHEIWSVTSRHGSVQVHDLGPTEPFELMVDRLVGLPYDRRLGTDLGVLLLRDGLDRATTDVLHVLIDGPLAKLPVAALRVGDRPIVALRPILRVAQLPSGTCDPQGRPAASVVLADPAGNLPAARAEATAVASHLGTVPKVGAEATRTAVFDTPANALLHVAVHGDLDFGEALRLHDGDISALDVTTRAHGPALVVMSTCYSATALDPEASGSIAAGFLAAGSRRVVATLGEVTDAGAAVVVEKFYRAGGDADAVRALAHAQAELAETTNRDWARFAVYGHDVCPP